MPFAPARTSLPSAARIVVVSASPLWGQGVVAALRDGTGWDVDAGGTDDPAEAWVSQGSGGVAPSEPIIVRGLDGAAALLAAHTPAARLRAAVGAVLQGLSVRDASTMAATRAWPSPMESMEPMRQPDPGCEPLTVRETEVFELLGKGLSNRDIAEVLGISAHTAKYHVAQILAKLGAATRAEAVREGLRQGWIGL